MKLQSEFGQTSTFLDEFSTNIALTGKPKSNISKNFHVIPPKPLTTEHVNQWTSTVWMLRKRIEDLTERLGNVISENERLKLIASRISYLQDYVDQDREVILVMF